MPHSYPQQFSTVIHELQQGTVHALIMHTGRALLWFAVLWYQPCLRLPPSQRYNHAGPLFTNRIWAPSQYKDRLIYVW